LYEHPDFQSMRGRFRIFGAIAVTLVAGGFLLYVLVSSFIPGLMNQPLAGPLTIGLALGLAQFVIMALVAWRYTVNMDRRVDPAARRLRAELDRAEPAQDRAAQQKGFPTW
jgi:uncharacterized membrane protein (DUF485 family)